MKLNSALVAVSVAAVAAFGIEDAEAAPLPPAHMHDARSVVAAPGGDDKLQVRTYTKPISEWIPLEGVLKEADQRLSEAVLTDPSAGPSHSAGASGGVDGPRAIGRVVKVYQANLYFLKHYNWHTSFLYWDAFEKHWQAYANEARARGIALPRPPEPHDHETSDDYAKRLFREHVEPVEELRKQRQT